MQVIRRSLINTFQRPAILIQSIRFDGSDPRSSTSSEKHKGSNSSLNKTKGGEKKQKSPVTDDTKQPGTTREDWSQPNKIVGNDPTYGKAGSPNSK